MRSVFRLFVKHLPVILFLFAYIIFAFATYKDFGPTTDENVERGAAEDLVRYMKSPTSSSLIMDKSFDSIMSDHGHHPLLSKYQRSYQALQSLVVFERYYEWDHLFNLIFGSTFFILVYLIFFKMYKSTWKAMIPVVFLALTPRLIGHIPANNKDMPFAFMYLFSLGAIYLFPFNTKNKYFRIIIIGLILGITQTFRTIGFSLYFVYIIYWIYFNWMSKTRFNIKMIIEFILELVIIVVFSLFVSVSIFPWLGSNFFANFYELLINAKDFQLWDGTMLYLGEYITKYQRPWHYLFVWIIITTPVFILALFAVIPFYAKKMFKNGFFVLLFSALIINFALYLILNPVIYNGLRHFLYLVPIITLMSSIVFVMLLDTVKRKVYLYVICALIIVGSLFVSYDMITLHPYQYIYFNELIGGLKGAQGKFATDYWGAGFKESTEWVVNNMDVTQDDYFYACTVVYSVDYYSRKKFFMRYGDYSTSDYTMCDVDSDTELKLKGQIIHEVKRQGVPLVRIRKYEGTN